MEKLFLCEPMNAPPAPAQLIIVISVLMVSPVSRNAFSFQAPVVSALRAQAAPSIPFRSVNQMTVASATLNIRSFSNSGGRNVGRWFSSKWLARFMMTPPINVVNRVGLDLSRTSQTS